MPTAKNPISAEMPNACSPLEKELDTLQKVIRVLAEEVLVLQGRLHPVLRPETLDAPQREDDTPPLLSPIEAVIRDLQQRADGIYRTITDIASRLVI